MENHIVEAARNDLAAGKCDHILTRFAPEPNAYIHIGSAISIAMTWGLAETLGGQYNLRFDDTNPEKERSEFVESIKEDIRWLGYDWEEREFYASDYFDQLYEWALVLIRKGKAYVCDLNEEEVREYRGTNRFGESGARITPPGKESPFRNRSIEENLDLFARMKAGEFPDGSRTLRAKIDMAHDNLLMRDPVMYRILHVDHQRTGSTWCIYPTYDWAHGQSDSIEGITHSICGMEFRVHRPLYDWFLDELGVFHPRQIEYTRINLTYTVTGKRYLKQLVEQGYVQGWDDPRLPTLRALRRRGVPPEAVRDFCTRLSISDAKIASTVDVEYFEHVLREHLNKSAPRYMAVLRPLKVVITNYPSEQVERLPAINNPEDPQSGTRLVPFSREIFIEQDDFMENPPKGFYRLAPGREVRLRYAYFIKCTDLVKNPDGSISELRCTYDPATRGGDAPDGRKVKSTLHWVSARHGVNAEARLYEHLFTKADAFEVEEGSSWTANFNDESLQSVPSLIIEPDLAAVTSGARVQFERIGYFCADNDSTAGHPVFNRIVSLRDTWQRMRARRAEA